MSKRKIHQAEKGDRKIELFDEGEVIEKTRADGIHRVSVEGRNICMDFFAINEELSVEGNEARDLIARIDMPIERFAIFAADVTKKLMQMGTAIQAAKEKQSEVEAA